MGVIELNCTCNSLLVQTTGSPILYRHLKSRIIFHETSVFFLYFLFLARTARLDIYRLAIYRTDGCEIELQHKSKGAEKSLHKGGTLPKKKKEHSRL